jgi:hypothetical protein
VSTLSLGWHNSNERVFQRLMAILSRNPTGDQFSSTSDTLQESPKEFAAINACPLLARCLLERDNSDLKCLSPSRCRSVPTSVAGDEPPVFLDKPIRVAAGNIQKRGRPSPGDCQRDRGHYQAAESHPKRTRMSSTATSYPLKTSATPGVLSASGRDTILSRLPPNHRQAFDPH